MEGASPVPKLLVKAQPGALLVGPSYELARTFPNQHEVTVAGIHFAQEDAPDDIGVELRRFAEAVIM